MNFFYFYKNISKKTSRFFTYLLITFVYDSDPSARFRGSSLFRKISKYINPSSPAFYVELGANDGIVQSNTYALHRRYKWNGILIEANPRIFYDLSSNRSFKPIPHLVHGACVPTDYKDKYVNIHEGDLMSCVANLDLNPTQISKHLEIAHNCQSLSTNENQFYLSPAFTLTNVLESAGCPKYFKFLSLDVEGNELAVLKGLDFGIYHPEYILAEVHDTSVIDYLCTNGYQVIEIFSPYSNCDDILFHRPI